jgi:fructose-bisphosphate aldolase class II
VLPLGEHGIPDGATVLLLEDLGIVARPAVERPPTLVSDAELIAAAGGGMVKVNIGTALNSAVTGAVRGTLEHVGALADWRRHLALASTAMADTLASVLRALAATTTRAR